MDKELKIGSVLLLCVMLLLLVFAVYFCVDWVMEFYDFKHSTPTPTKAEALAFTFTYFFETIFFYVKEIFVSICGIILACINKKIAQDEFTKVTSRVFFWFFIFVLIAIATLLLISFVGSLF